MSMKTHRLEDILNKITDMYVHCRSDVELTQKLAEYFGSENLSAQAAENTEYVSMRREIEAMFASKQETESAKERLKEAYSRKHLDESEYDNAEYAKIVTREQREKLIAEQQQQQAKEDGEVQSATYVKSVNNTSRSTQREINERFSHIIGKRIKFAYCSDIKSARDNVLKTFPYAQAVVDKILKKPARMSHTKKLTINPTLIVGGAGTGKSSLARAIFGSLKMPAKVVNLGGSTDDHFLGLSSGYSTGSASCFTSSVSEQNIINPAFVFDELDKCARDKNNNVNIHDRLLAVLEKTEATRFREAYLNTNVDVSHMNFIFTANSLHTIPDYLLSRLTIIEMPTPDVEHLDVVVNNLLKAILKEEGLDERWMPSFTREEMNAIKQNWESHRNMRTLKKQVESIYDDKTNVFEMKAC